MIICMYNPYWLYRKAYRYLLSQRRRERRGFMVVCRSDFSRELFMFATEAAPTNTHNYICALCASARKQDVKPPTKVSFPVIPKPTTTV